MMIVIMFTIIFIVSIIIIILVLLVCLFVFNLISVIFIHTQITTPEKQHAW